MRLLFCGDIMPGGVLPYQKEYITPRLSEYLKGFDFRIGTLEAAIGTGLAYDPVKEKGRQNIVYARNEDFYRVKELGINVVSLANNHIWDLGETGLRNTIERLEESGIQYCGAGLDIDGASRPVVLEKDGITVAVLACCVYGSIDLGHVRPAQVGSPGVNPLIIETIVNDIRKAKRDYDYVVVLPHWGREYSYEPLPECIKMARQMIDAGADAVLGSHTHQIQPTVFYKRKPICFSMGNFLFPDFYMYPPRPIWYPDEKEDLSGIKDIVGYPFPITEPLRQVWNSVSRFGRMVSLSINSRGLFVHMKTVHMMADNILDLSELPSAMRRQLIKNKWMINSSVFRRLIVSRRTFAAYLKKYVNW